MSAQATPQYADTTISAIQYVGQYVIQHNETFKGSIIGGLSGVDYDPDNNLYYLLSDDRSVINPARLYTAQIKVTATGIEGVTFQDVITLKQSNGKPYESPTVNPYGAIDPEALRYDRKHKQLVWTSEGEKRFKGKEKIFIDPAVNTIQTDGHFLSGYHLPENLKMHESEGPRQNSALEGLTFNTSFTTLFTCLEEPLYQDGHKADLNLPNALTRIHAFDVTSRNNITQYAYPLEAVAFPAVPAQSFKVNGVSEILYVREKELLVVERSFSTGKLGCTIKIFLADLSKAENVKDLHSLQGLDLTKAASKKLLFNLDNLGIYIDNIEAVTFGPRLPNGHLTLIFVTDNNFLPIEQTQFFLFEVIP